MRIWLGTEQPSCKHTHTHTHTHILSLSIIWVLDLGQTIVCLSKSQNNDKM